MTFCDFMCPQELEQLLRFALNWTSSPPFFFSRVSQCNNRISVRTFHSVTRWFCIESTVLCNIDRSLAQDKKITHRTSTDVSRRREIMAKTHHIDGLEERASIQFSITRLLSKALGQFRIPPILPFASRGEPHLKYFQPFGQFRIARFSSSSKTTHRNQTPMSKNFLLIQVNH